VTCVGRCIARISIYEGNPRRLRRYRCRRRSPASTSTSTLCACRVATRRANTVRVITLDGCSKRACMRHSSSLHVAHQLPANRAVHFPTDAAVSPQGLSGFAALYPNCGKQKNLPRVYDMRHNFASHRLFILHDLISENAKTTALARAKWQMPRDQAETHAFAAFWPCFSASQPRRDTS
jgi:hypothetical protein